jgi:carboxyl-terminal processing protease
VGAEILRASRRTRILTLLSLLLLLFSVGGVTPPLADAARLAETPIDFEQQGRTGEERRPDLEIVYEVLRQAVDNYLLALDPVRLAAGAIEGMSKATDNEQVTAEREEDAVRLRHGESSVLIPLARDDKTNRDGLRAAFEFIRKASPAAPVKELTYGAIDGILSQLDPHSSFMPPEAYRETQLETQGTFGGVGIQIAVKDRQLTVVMPIAGTPAERAGLQPGDRITNIDRAPTRDMTFTEAVHRLRGAPGTTVAVTILRLESPGPFTVTLTREIIALKPIKAEELEHAIGYIRILSFSEQSGRDLQQAAQSLTEKGVRGLILDLRGNRGGLFNESVRTAELFLEVGQPVVSTTSRHKNEAALFKTKRPGLLQKVPVIVLVNGTSASASEIVAGALQDLKRALVIGSKTYGKGSVQTIIPLSDGSALRLTTSRYLTPRGRTIDGAGIDPDLLVRNPEDERSSVKLAPQSSAKGRNREQSRIRRDRLQRKIADQEDDPSVVIGRRETLDLHKDQALGLAWRTLQAAQGADVDKLLGAAKTLLPAQRGAELDLPAGSVAPQ